MSIEEKIIKVRIILGAQDDSFDGENNTIIFDGLRTSCQIQYGNGAVLPSAHIRIYGLKMANMAKLLRVQWNTKQALQNLIQIEAGDSNKTSIVYSGNITFAKPDFTSAPDVSLIIESHTGIQHQLMPTPPRSFEGEIDVAQAIKQLADDMGFIFENNGVTAKLSNQYLDNTAMAQVQKLAWAADIDLYIENNIIAIAPKGAPRTIDVPVISPQTGLIGYPVPDLIGVQFMCLYDPAVRFGGLVQITNSMIEQCNGKWRVFGLSISLDSKTPNGKWQAEVRAAIAESKNTHVAK